MNPSEKHTLEIDSVELSFGDRRILSGVYLAVETGGVSAVLGRNGCGKSCLMKILCGSLRAGFRSMRIDGVWHDRFRADEVRYLPQQGFIPGWLTLDRVLRDYDMTRGDLLKWFPLFEKLFGTKIYAMSGGERRILECYLILRSPTRFILLDEPFSQVAPLHVSALKRLILQERASKGILLTDHMHRHVTDLADRLYVMADIPGIIEGAHEGRGLGTRFLRHIERNSVLLFMIPADSDDVRRDYEVLLGELMQYNPELLDKERLLAVTKCDMLDEELIEQMKPHLPEGIPSVFISSVSGLNISRLKDMLWEALQR